MHAAPGENGRANVNWPIPDSIVAQLPSQGMEGGLVPKNAKVPFAGTRSVVNWLEYAIGVHQRDKVAERRKRVLSIAAALALLPGIGFVVVGLSVDSTAGLWAGALSIAAGTVLLIVRRKYSKIDIEDSKLEAFTSTLYAVAPELKERKPVTAAVDFTAFTEHPDWTVRNREVYSQRWLELTLPLKDGSQASIAVTLSVKQKSKLKRRYTKVKQRRVESVRVRLTPPAGVMAQGLPQADRYRGRTVSWLTLSQISILPNAATFVWKSPAMLLVRQSVGWSAISPIYSVGAKELVSVLSASHRLAAGGGRHAQ